MDKIILCQYHYTGSILNILASLGVFKHVFKQPSKPRHALWIWTQRHHCIKYRLLFLSPNYLNYVYK